jgi:hypothetical protein
MNIKEENILVVKNSEKVSVEKSENSSKNAVPGKPSVFFH